MLVLGLFCEWWSLETLSPLFLLLTLLFLTPSLGGEGDVTISPFKPVTALISFLEKLIFILERLSKSPI